MRRGGTPGNRRRRRLGRPHRGARRLDSIEGMPIQARRSRRDVAAPWPRPRRSPGFLSRWRWWQRRAPGAPARRLPARRTRCSRRRTRPHPWWASGSRSRSARPRPRSTCRSAAPCSCGSATPWPSSPPASGTAATVVAAASAGRQQARPRERDSHHRPNRRRSAPDHGVLPLHDPGRSIAPVSVQFKMNGSLTRSSPRPAAARGRPPARPPRAARPRCPLPAPASPTLRQRDVERFLRREGPMPLRPLMDSDTD